MARCTETCLYNKLCWWTKPLNVAPCRDYKVSYRVFLFILYFCRVYLSHIKPAFAVTSHVSCCARNSETEIPCSLDSEGRRLLAKIHFWQRQVLSLSFTSPSLDPRFKQPPFHCVLLSASLGLERPGH